MSDDLISRKSVLDYIENEISTAKSKETISYLRALSVHINEYEPTAFDVDKVIEKIDKDINWYQFLKDNLKCNGTVITSDRGVITTKQAILQNVKDIVKAGGIDD